MGSANETRDFHPAIFVRATNWYTIWYPVTTKVKGELGCKQQSTLALRCKYKVSYAMPEEQLWTDGIAVCSRDSFLSITFM